MVGPYPRSTESKSLRIRQGSFTCQKVAQVTLIQNWDWEPLLQDGCLSALDIPETGSPDTYWPLKFLLRHLTENQNSAPWSESYLVPVST